MPIRFFLSLLAAFAFDRAFCLACFFLYACVAPIKVRVRVRVRVRVKLKLMVRVRVSVRVRYTPVWLGTPYASGHPTSLDPAPKVLYQAQA